MQTTPAARYAPSRTLEPPGTMRTPSMMVVGRTPSRKPTRMPLLTHELTRHTPSSSRSAARTSPRLSACLNASKTSRSVELNSPPFENNSSTCSRSDMRPALRQPQLFEHFAHALPRLLRHRHERQPQILFEHAHQGQRGLDGAGTRLDEVHVH